MLVFIGISRYNLKSIFFACLSRQLKNKVLRSLRIVKESKQFKYLSKKIKALSPSQKINQGSLLCLNVNVGLARMASV